MADITPPLPEGRQIIQRYGGGGFRIAGTDHAGSVLVTPERTVAWGVSDAAAIDPASLTPLLAEAPERRSEGAVLLVGTGEAMVPLPPEVRQALRRAGFGVEIMDTGAACRTFNVLLAEERAVLAALIAVA
jgi:uncharacterized protein